MEASMTLRITEAELVRDVRAVLDKIERGNEVIIEREDHRPLAVMKQPQPVAARSASASCWQKLTKKNSATRPSQTRTLPRMCRKVSTRAVIRSATSGTNNAWD